MRYPKQFIVAGTFAAAAMILSSCTAVVEDGRPLPPRPDRGPICTREYAPVCGERGRDHRTFANSCLAKAEGYRITNMRECRDGRPDRGDRNDRGDRHGRDRGDRNDRNDRHDRGDRDRGGQRACTMEYAPVCARRGHDQRTFSNACQARAAQYTAIRGGRC